MPSHFVGQVPFLHRPAINFTPSSSLVIHLPLFAPGLQQTQQARLVANARLDTIRDIVAASGTQITPGVSVVAMRHF